MAQTPADGGLESWPLPPLKQRLRVAESTRNRHFGALAKNGTSTRSSSTGQFLTVRKRAVSGVSKVKFGSVTISGAKPSAAAVKTNVERSSAALERVAKKISRPGVVIRAKKDVPQFSAAEGETGVFVRKLNGRIDRGRLVDGTFKVLD